MTPLIRMALVDRWNPTLWPTGARISVTGPGVDARVTAVFLVILASTAGGCAGAMHQAEVRIPDARITASDRLDTPPWMEEPSAEEVWVHVDVDFPDACDDAWVAAPSQRILVEQTLHEESLSVVVMESVDQWVPDARCRLALRTSNGDTVETARRGALSRLEIRGTAMDRWGQVSSLAWLSMPDVHVGAWNGWYVGPAGWTRAPVHAIALRRPMTEEERDARDACSPLREAEPLSLFLRAWSADRRASPSSAEAQRRTLLARLPPGSATYATLVDLLESRGPADAAYRLNAALDRLQDCPDFPELTLLVAWLAARAELPELLPERALRGLASTLPEDDAAALAYLLAESTGDPDSTGQAAEHLLYLESAHQVLGVLHLASLQRDGSGSPSTTRSHLEPWADDDVFGARVHFELASIAELRGDLDLAQATYLEALDRDDRFAEAANALGFLAVEAQRWPQARDRFLEALALEPDLSEAANNLGFVLEHGFGDLDGALQAYQRAVSSDPQNAAAWMNLGQLLEARGAPVSESMQAYERAIAVNPGDDMARRALQGLRARPLATIQTLAGTWESADPSARSSCLWTFLANGEASLACHTPRQPSLVIEARWVQQDLRASQMRLLLLAGDTEMPLLLDVLDEDRIVLFSDAAGPFPLLLRRRAGDTSI